MENENREKLKKVFVSIFKNIDQNNFDFNKDRSQFENWDSLTHMQLISEIEGVFNINFEMDEIVTINKPEDLLVLIEKKNNNG